MIMTINDNGRREEKKKKMVQETKRRKMVQVTKKISTSIKSELGVVCALIGH